MGEVQVEEVDPSSGTGAGMIAFLNFAINRNEMIEGTAVALRTGVNRVLETDESFRQMSVQDMDVDDVLRRFRIKFRGKMKDASLSEYEKRFRQTADMYRKWLIHDPSWRPAPRKVTAPRRSKAENGASGTAVKPAGSVSGSQKTRVAPGVSNPPAPDATMITYPYPVRPGLVAQVSLPADLTVKEAERVAKFVASLAFEERLAITGGRVVEAEMVEG
jgi:hypothetical protein